MLDRLKARREHADGGFTLIELLLVIVILGILAAVVVFSVRGISDRGTGASCKATKGAIQTGVEAAYAQAGAYPANLSAASISNLVDLTNVAGTPAGAVTSVSDKTGTPAWTMVYAQTGGGTGYTLNVTLPVTGICA